MTIEGPRESPPNEEHAKEQPGTSSCQHLVSRQLISVYSLFPTNQHIFVAEPHCGQPIDEARTPNKQWPWPRRNFLFILRPYFQKIGDSKALRECAPDGRTGRYGTKLEMHLIAETRKAACHVLNDFFHFGRLGFFAHHIYLRDEHLHSRIARNYFLLKQSAQ